MILEATVGKLCAKVGKLGYMVSQLQGFGGGMLPGFQKSYNQVNADHLKLAGIFRYLWPKFIHSMRFLSGLGILCCLLAGACAGDGKRDVRDYYYPLDDLWSGKVYEYDLAAGDSSSPEYRYFRTIDRDSGLFLTGTFYDSRFQIGQIIREGVGEEGIYVKEYSLYDADPETGRQIQANAVIDSPEVFPFRVKDSVGVYMFSMNYQPPADPNTTIFLNRRRIFLGDAPAFEFRGQTYICIRFGLLEEIGTQNGGTDLLEGRGEEWYAKDLGLVYYRKTFGDKNQIKVEYKLRDVYPMSELEKKAAAFFGD